MKEFKEQKRRDKHKTKLLPAPDDIDVIKQCWTHFTLTIRLFLYTNDYFNCDFVGIKSISLDDSRLREIES